MKLQDPVSISLVKTSSLVPPQLQSLFCDILMQEIVLYNKYSKTRNLVDFRMGFLNTIYNMNGRVVSADTNSS